MPAKQDFNARGLHIAVEPRSRLRRMTRFPLFFENTYTAFSVVIRRLEKQQDWDYWPDGVIPFYVKFENGEVDRYAKVPVPDLQVGESATMNLPKLFVPHGGATLILSRFMLPNGESRDVEMYSYHVWRTDQLFLALLGPVVSVALIAFGAFAESKVGLLTNESNTVMVTSTPVSEAPSPTPHATASAPLPAP